MSDEEIQKLESQFPALSGEAFAAARQQALDAGLSVVESENDCLYEIFPDGRRTFVKKISPPTLLWAGSVYEIK